MTQPSRRTLPVDIGPHKIVMQQLSELQLLHITRMARILSSDKVANEQKFEIVEQMLDILHNLVLDEKDQQLLITAEMKGEITLSHYLEVVNAFQDEQKSEAKPVVRRGRPRKQ